MLRHADLRGDEKSAARDARIGSRRQYDAGMMCPYVPVLRVGQRIAERVVGMDRSGHNDRLGRVAVAG